MLNLLLTLNFTFSLLTTATLKLLSYRLILGMKRYLLISFALLAIYHLYYSMTYFKKLRTTSDTSQQEQYRAHEQHQAAV